jgi:hypothetical protein
MLRSVALLAALAVSVDSAGATCPSLIGPLDSERTAARVDKLERLLDREHRNLRAYRVGWATVFAAAAIGQVGLAELVGEPRDISIQVSAVKATIGASVTPFLAPRFDMPEAVPGQEPCARLADLERTLVYVARRERRGVALYQHGLGAALNVAGLLYLGLFHDQWVEGLLGALIGSAVGELRLWTQPRRAIRAVDGAKEERGPWIGVAPMGMGARVVVRF